MSWRRYRERTLRRRSWLKGLGLGATGLFLAPMVRQLEAQAGGSAAPKRLLIVVEGNGYYGFRNWKSLPESAPEISELGSLAQDLPQARALTPWKSRLAAINGLANKQGFGLGAGHRSHWYPLTCMPYAGSSAPGGPSIDQLLGEALGEACVFPVVRLGAAGEAGNAPPGLVPTNCAFGRGQPAPSQHNPERAWRELFGVTSDDPAERAAFEERGLLLDFLKDDVERVRPKLATEERWKMDHYLSSLETFQVRHQRLTEREGQLRECAPSAPPVTTGQDVCDDVGLQLDLAAASMICGLTNIAVVSVASGPFTFTTFGNWGFGGRHTMGHGRGETAQWPGGPDGLVETHNKIAQEVARFIQTLESTPEGAGNMFDNTAVVLINDNGSEHHSKYDNYPVVVCGDLGGNLELGGRLIEYPNHTRPAARGLAQFWNTIAQAMGAPLTGFGEGGRAPNEGTLTELMG